MAADPEVTVSTRLARAQQTLRDLDVGALLVGPSADLRYLVGYHALPLERLTLLLVPAEGTLPWWSRRWRRRVRPTAGRPRSRNCSPGRRPRTPSTWSATG
jgi:Xaa-Pro aminopeptidase